MTFEEWCQDLDELAELHGLENIGSLERFRTDFQGGFTPESVLQSYLLPKEPESAQ